MPTPKRWFPLSRDFNDDPETWELTEEFGDRAIRIPLEVFACIDKTENEWRLTGRWLDGLSRKVRQKPATVQRVIDWMLAKGWLVADRTTVTDSVMVLRARNYWKYHRRREPNGNQEGAALAPPLPNLPKTNLPVTNLHEEKKDAVTDAAWLASLTADQTYIGIDIQREAGKCQNWCREHGKVFTRRRFVNWLNRAERPLIQLIPTTQEKCAFPNESCEAKALPGKKYCERHGAIYRQAQQRRKDNDRVPSQPVSALTPGHQHNQEVPRVH